jgi:intermediate peptidase
MLSKSITGIPKKFFYEGWDSLRFYSYRYLFNGRESSLSNELIDYFDATPDINVHRSHKMQTGMCSKIWLQSPQDLIEKAHQVIHKGNTMVNELMAQKSWPLKLLLHRFDTLSDLLCEVIDTAELLRYVHPDESYRICAENACQMVGLYMQSLNTHDGLYEMFKRHATSTEAFESLNPEEKTVCRSFLDDFEMSRIESCSEKRATFMNIQEEIQRLGWKFVQAADRQNIQHGEREVSCKNLPPDTSSSPSVMRSLLTTSRDPQIRQQAYRSLYAPDNDRLNVLATLLKCRRDLANHLDYRSYGEFFLHDKLAKHPKHVMKFLDQLSNKLMPLAQKEYELLKTKYREYYGHTPQSIAIWDKWFLMNEARKDLLKYIEGHHIQYYFSLGHCISGLNDLLETTFRVQLRPSISSADELWSPAVRKLELWKIDEDDDRNLFLGSIYLDLFPRAHKYTHAAHFTLQCSKTLSSNQRKYPIVTIVCNFTLPNVKKIPCLLSYSDVTTLFHEMGHALHGKLKDIIVAIFFLFHLMES